MGLNFSIKNQSNMKHSSSPVRQKDTVTVISLYLISLGWVREQGTSIFPTSFRNSTLKKAVLLCPRHLLSILSLWTSKWASLIYFISQSYLFRRTALVSQKKKRCSLETRLCLRDISSIKGHRTHKLSAKCCRIKPEDSNLCWVANNSNSSFFLVKKIPSRWDPCC